MFQIQNQSFCRKFSRYAQFIYNIYPRKLEIKAESNNPKQVAYLDLKIVSEASSVIFSTYDKRDSFSFSIVNFPFKDSCIPKNQH